MSLLDDAPRYCPHCDAELTLDTSPDTKDEVHGITLSIYCDNCENDYWHTVGFEAFSEDDFDDDLKDDLEDDSEDDLEDDSDDDLEDADDISFLYPNDDPEDAFEDAFDRMWK